MSLLVKNNLSNKIYGLVVILALFLFSCEDPNEIGLSLNPDDQVGVNFVELPVSAVNTLQEAVITSRPGRLLAGTYNDPDFGKVTAKGYAEVKVNTKNIEEGAVFDSLTLTLKVDYLQGPTTEFTSQRVIVKQLADTLTFDTIYYNHDSVRTSLSILGEKSYSLMIGDTISMTLDENVGRTLFDQAVLGTFSSQSDFKKLFSGISIEGDESNNSVIGFTTSEASKLSIHYHTATDTLLLDFAIDNTVPAFNYIQGDRTGTPLEQLMANEATEPVDGKLYMQAGTGVTSIIDLSSFNAFASADSNANIIINRGELTIGGVGTSTGQFTPPPAVWMLFVNENNEMDTLPRGLQESQVYSNAIADNNFEPFLFYENPRSVAFFQPKSYYADDVSLFLQNVGNRKFDLPGLLLFPVGSGEIAQNNRNSVNQAMFNANDIKLKIYYTSIEK